MTTITWGELKKAVENHGATDDAIVVVDESMMYPVFDVDYGMHESEDNPETVFLVTDLREGPKK